MMTPADNFSLARGGLSKFHSRRRSTAGIALGPILFIIALLAIIGAVIAAGSGGFGTATITDRVAADVATQANLIRAKINECNITYGTQSNGDGYPSSDTTNGTLVSALNCAGDPAGMQNLWSGQRVAMQPQPTQGFGEWYYINTNPNGLGGVATNGRCIWTQPTIANPETNVGLVEGLKRAASKFTNATSYANSAEVTYDPASSSQKFVVWITMPLSGGTPDPHCVP